VEKLEASIDTSGCDRNMAKRNAPALDVYAILVFFSLKIL